MGIFTGIDSEQELAEAYAVEQGGISSEDELSEQFDAQVAPAVIKQYGEDDTVAMNEAFNCWSDALCKEGDIHATQYDQYCYTGKYSDD